MWEDIPLPGEVVQISCGPGDLLWAVMWEGQLIVREGISSVCPRGTSSHSWREIVFEIYCLCVCICYIINSFDPGTSWKVMESPSPDVGAIHVAVGIGVVWVVTKDYKVRSLCYKFRKYMYHVWNTAAGQLLFNEMLY